MVELLCIFLQPLGPLIIKNVKNTIVPYFLFDIDPELQVCECSTLSRGKREKLFEPKYEGKGAYLGVWVFIFEIVKNK